MTAPTNSSAAIGINNNSQLINDGQIDVAENEFREHMRVGFSGRMTFQKIHVRGNHEGKVTAIQYDPATDIPNQSTVSITPTRQELEGRDNTVLMLVVGLVIAKDPQKYVSKGKKTKAKIAAQKQRGILTRPRKVLLALIEVTEYVQRASRFFVAVNKVNGLCDMRIIHSTAIFYFSEFMNTTGSKKCIRRNKKALSEACKLAAARNKTPRPDQQSVNLIEDNDGESTDSSDSIEKNREAREDAMEEVEPTPLIDSVESFLDERNKSFTVEDASSMLQVLEAADDFLPPIVAGMLVDVRKILKEEASLSLLSRASLPAFLDTLDVLARANMSTEELLEVVHQTLLIHRRAERRHRHHY